MIIIASSSELKYNAVSKILSNVQRSKVNYGQLTITPQPIGYDQAIECCKQRIALTRVGDSIIGQEGTATIIAIESFIDIDEHQDWFDLTLVMIADPLRGTSEYVSPTKIPIPRIYYPPTGTTNLSETIGSRIHNDIPHVPADDWYSLMSNMTRTDVIVNTIKTAWGRHYHFEKYLEKHPLKIYKDYPKDGVDFADMFSATVNPEFILNLKNAFRERLSLLDWDGLAIVGLESRGMMLGWGVSIDTLLKYIPIRKLGKLPGRVIGQSFQKEYGIDTLEMQNEYQENITHVVIVDDVIATGGSMFAACQLCERLGLRVDLIMSITDIPSLRTQYQKKLQGYNLAVLG